MDAVIIVLGFALLVALLFVAGVLTSPMNRRRVAAWCLASAKAMDERRAALAGIEEERRLHQYDLEKRFGCEVQVHPVAAKTGGVR